MSPAKKKKAAARKRKRRCTALKRQRPKTAAAKRRRRRALKRACGPVKKPRRKVAAPAPVVPAEVAPKPGSPGPVPAPPAPPRLTTIASPIAVWSGTFGRRQAERLLWRAGFGPRPGDIERLVSLGLERAVLSLTRPTGVAPMDGPEPTVGGEPLSAYDTWYGPHIYWLDRMVRSRHQLVERLALVFHDWWATSNAGVGSNRLMLDQTNIFRVHGLGSFAEMTRAVTTDPAMLVFLNGIDNRRRAVNENYARELMELFTLGADRGAYTETDVRELARSLTGWRADWTDGVGLHDFRYDPNRWDSGTKTVFGRTGAFDWEDACRLVLEHPMHASFFVRKLWSAFIPTPPPAAVSAKLEQLYVSRGHAIRPVLEAILCSPEFYDGPRMVKPPVVLCAGLLRAGGRAITGSQWSWLCAIAGQQLYEPPNVSGWDDARWMDSNTARARWDIVNYALEGRTQRPDSAWGSAYPAETPAAAVAAARAFWMDPALSADTVASLQAFAAAQQPPADTGSTPAWQRKQRAQQRAQRQTALRMLVAVSPDHQTC